MALITKKNFPVDPIDLYVSHTYNLHNFSVDWFLLRKLIGGFLCKTKVIESGKHKTQNIIHLMYKQTILNPRTNLALIPLLGILGA